jgi:hypothetical protein
MSKETALIVCATILIILCVGSPDLLDVIIARVGSGIAL